MSRTAIFLGAGASKAEGAPLQGELFRDYFSSTQFKGGHDVTDESLVAFFSLMFGIDVNADLSKVIFPTFEEVLGLTDLAILRKEGFRHFGIENRAVNSGQLRFIAQYLVFLVAKVLDAKLQTGTGLHRDLVGKLFRNDMLKRTVFVSTNYDILIDNALTELYAQKIDLDYGIDFRNFDRKNSWKRPKPKNRVFLFKPHGSLNWLFCPTCNQLEITPKEKGVVTRLISDFAQATCDVCNSVYVPLIVPPTFYKDLNNVFLSSVWSRADISLREADHVVFCGYSFPDADIHIKYMLKRAQTNRDKPQRYTVINHFNGKQGSACEDERNRYQRFLGTNLNYLEMSFEEFVNDPMPILAY